VNVERTLIVNDLASPELLMEIDIAAVIADGST